MLRTWFGLILLVLSSVSHSNFLERHDNQYLNFQSCETYYIATESSFNQNYVSNFNFVAFNNSIGKSHVNFTFELLIDIDKIFNSCIINVKSNEGLRDYDLHFLRSALDTCKVSQGILGKYLLKNVQTNTQRFGNIPLACPHKKGSYYLYNFPRINETNFPALFPHHRGQWEATFTFKARVMKSMKLTQLFHYKIQGVSFA